MVTSAVLWVLFVTLLMDQAFATDKSWGSRLWRRLKNARRTTREFKELQRQNPIFKKVVEGKIEPDKFFEELVLRSPASTLEKTLALLPADGLAILKNQTLQYIKDKASNGVSDNTARLSSAAMNRVLKNLGEEKLKMLFSQQEIRQLKAINNVARFEQFQPVGSAVNNSNTSSAVGGMIDRIAQSSILGKLPLGQVLAKDPLMNISAGIGAGRAFNTADALRQAANQPRLPFNPLYAPSLLSE